MGVESRDHEDLEARRLNIGEDDTEEPPRLPRLPVAREGEGKLVSKSSVMSKRRSSLSKPGRDELTRVGLMLGVSVAIEESIACCFANSSSRLSMRTYSTASISFNPI